MTKADLVIVNLVQLLYGKLGCGILLVVFWDVQMVRLYKVECSHALAEGHIAFAI